MKKTLIRDGIVVNNGFKSQKDILIEGDIIIKVESNITPEPEMEIIESKGLFVLPGLIDDQVHFREPGLTHKGNIRSESISAIAGGITSYIEMPNTIPQTTSKKELDNKFKIASKNSAANYSFLFGGTNDNIDEILNLDKNQVAGIKLFLGSSTGNMLVDNPDTLKKIFRSTDLLIAVHCEDEETIKNNLEKYLHEFGEDIPVSKHPSIRSEDACYISSSKAISLAKETGARLHVFHLSTGKETKLFSNSELINKKITSEVCIHHLWFSDKDYKKKGAFIKWNPAIKSKSDQNELWKALNDDRIDIIASDHAPHTISEKNNSYLNSPSGGPLVQHSLLSLLTAVKKGKISIEKLVQKACHNPAILFEISKRGFIKEGYFADLVIINLDAKTKVTKESLLYKCGWSPFEGITFDAKIEKTFVNGIKVYENRKILKTDAGRQLTFDR